MAQSIPPFIASNEFREQMDRGKADFRYVSDVDTNWGDVIKVFQKMDKKKNDYQGIGLLNFNDTEITHWKHLISDANHMEQEEDVPVCPALPKIEVPGKRLDLIAVKLPVGTKGIGQGMLLGCICSYPQLVWQHRPTAQVSACPAQLETSLILVDESINVFYRSGLEAAGWKLTEYDKIIFIDADLLILRNIDFLFGMPEISATGNNATLFTPVFTWWHRIPRHMNFLKHFWSGDEEDVKQKKTRLFGSDPPVLYSLLAMRHMKDGGKCTTRCRRNYSSLLVEIEAKGAVGVDRREAEKANFSDGHWRMKVKDRRRKKCIDNVCEWESMLKHWVKITGLMMNFMFQHPPAINTASLYAL
ncbi:hypothetical protein F3Y22_tig00110013pilonHSYRG00539 [Hibiscus syriacus]|uniref:Hexosyltransferase n=1 Tax=Hibiscus syriacus TaxID=106335 RepID=A0A6A3BQA8_HIBSY|nr:hypothetical protein F3Y22_tig00110013pilonHSYRG00539 [Hibiscus syriacus]